MPCLFEFWTILLNDYNYVILGVEGYLPLDSVVRFVHTLLT